MLQEPAPDQFAGVRPLVVGAPTTLYWYLSLSVQHRR